MENYDDEQLVAFLDGELSSDEAQQIETQLESDESLQQRVDDLRNTWDLLLELPDEPPNQELTQSTLEFVTVQLEKEQDHWFNRLRRSFLALFAIIIGSALIAGWGFGHFAKTRIANRLLDNLHCVADYDAFEKLGDSTFEDSKNWVEKLSEIPNLPIAFPAQGLGKTEVPGIGKNGERQKWIDQLEEEQRDVLINYASDFSSAATPDSTRRVADWVYSQEDGSAKLELLRSYAKLLESQPQTYAFDLRGKETEERLEIVKKLVNEKMRFRYLEQIPRSDQFRFERFYLEKSANSFSPEVQVDPVSANELADDLSELAKSILEPQSDGEKIQTLEFWINSVVYPTTSDELSTEALVEQLEKLKNDPSTVSDYARIELLPEDEARAELRAMIRSQEDE
ncbi:MAG: anti-sigma factor family protein [Aureliella sp.]